MTGFSPTPRLAAGAIIGVDTDVITNGAAANFYEIGRARTGLGADWWKNNNAGPLGNGGTGGYFGFKFVAASGTTHYGWMRLSIGSTSATSAIVDYAYESTAGQSIGAGAVPAPGALALLGLAALATRRRRA